MVELKKLVVSDAGVELAYTDSGAPPDKSSYITVFALHGMCFSAPIYQKAQVVAPQKGIRLVALNRRNYPGSSSLTTQDLEVINSGSAEQKAAWLADRGHEIGTFIAKFITINSIPPISDDGQFGGYILLGWSVGTGESNATIACAGSLPDRERFLVTSYLRAYILHEGAPIMYGLPMPPRNWAPFIEQSIPSEDRLPTFGQWVTGYFDHGDLSSHDLDVLTYVLVSTDRPGTIYNMTPAEQSEIIFTGAEASFEGPYMGGLQAQLNDVFKQTLFDSQTRKLFPHLNPSCITGTRSPSWAIASHWALEDETKTAAGLPIKLKLVTGTNHFVQWDEPEKIVDLLLELK